MMLLRIITDVDRSVINTLVDSSQYMNYSSYIVNLR